MKQNLRKGRNVQYNGKRLSQCINSSDSSFSSFLSAPKKKEFRWEASSLEVESARYSKTTNYHASFLRYSSLLQTAQNTAMYKTVLCRTRYRSAPHSQVSAKHSHAYTVRIQLKKKNQENKKNHSTFISSNIQQQSFQ